MNPAPVENRTGKDVDEAPPKSCDHYQRSCDIIATCCQKQFACRICHDSRQDHLIDRFATEQVCCKVCQQIQPISNQCCNSECARVFGSHYYCQICRLWSHDTEKAMYHCDKCGICRRGPEKDYFHCQKCDACISIGLKETHVCVEKTLHSQCPVCNEVMFHSTEGASILKCGHGIHRQCLENYIQHNYVCPLCKKCIQDMSDYWRQLDELMLHREMPDEYRDWQVQVHCNDCSTKSVISFDFQFHKCQQCGGYNTQVDRIIKNASESS